MAVNEFNLAAGQRAERKTLITVAQWQNSTGGSYYVEQLSKPADWDTKYTGYYTRTGTSPNYTYENVTGTTAPNWEAGTYYTRVDREILGTRTEDSSIEYNADIQTSTDIRGINYTDINKTQPQQDFDPFLILGGSKLGALLNDKRKRNALSELSDFTIYVITAFVGSAETGYEAEMQEGCTITYNSMGGDANVNFPISVYLSNNTTNGTVDVLKENYVFTPDTNI